MLSSNVHFDEIRLFDLTLSATGAIIAIASYLLIPKQASEDLSGYDAPNCFLRQIKRK